MTTSFHIFFDVHTVTWIASDRLPKRTVQMRRVDVSFRSFEKVTLVLHIYICVTLHVVGMLMTWIMLLQRSCSCECHWVMSLTRMRQVTVARLDEWESYRWYKFATLHVLCVSMTRICRSHATPLVTELSVEYVLICQTVQYNLNLCLAQVRLFIKFLVLQDCTLEKA